MKIRLLFICVNLFIYLILMQSCSKKNTSTFWVNSYKEHCMAGAGPSQCLQISKTKDLENPNWQLFYSPIEGFNFEEGYLQKISVTSEKIPADKVPADASSIKYTLSKTLEKIKDPRTELNGRWIPQSINGTPMNVGDNAPTLTVNVEAGNISGSDGCNNYVGNISNITATQFKAKPIAGTQKMCKDMSLANQYTQALSKAQSYKITDGKLSLYDQNNKELLTFNKGAQMASIEDSNWKLVRMSGKPLEGVNDIPTLSFNLKDQVVSGTDGCNSYSGALKKSTNGQFILGLLTSTKKYCQGDIISGTFQSKLSKAKLYSFENQLLILMDENGNELLAFIQAN